MLEILEGRPDLFLLHALPLAARGSFPTQVQAYLEDHVEYEGTLTVTREDDFERSQTKTSYSFASEGRHFTLHFAKNPPALLTGSKIKVRGVHLDSQIVLALGDGSPSVQTIASAAASVSGDQRTVVLLANFLDKALSCSATTVYGLMFTDSLSINRFYQESSFNQISFSGDVFGPYTIPYYSTDACNYIIRESIKCFSPQAA